MILIVFVNIFIFTFIYKRNRNRSIELEAVRIYKELLRLLQNQPSIPFYQIQDMIKKAEEKDKKIL